MCNTYHLCILLFVQYMTNNAKSHVIINHVDHFVTQPVHAMSLKLGHLLPSSAVGNYKLSSEEKCNTLDSSLDV